MGDKTSTLSLLAGKAATFKLSQTLASRLKFANFKVARGLEDKTFREVADLVDGESLSGTASPVESPRSDRMSMSPSSKRRHQVDDEGHKRARVSMSPENESEAVELLMALSAHSTRASASPEPEIGASGSKDDDSNLAQNLPSTSAAEVPQQNSLSTPPMVDAAAAKDVVDASSNRSRPSGTTADDADRGQNLNNPAETMIQLVIMGPPSPSGSWSDGLEGSRDSGASTGKGGDSADESNAAPSPPPAAPLHFMQSFTPGAIVV